MADHPSPESGPNELDDETHARLDKEVLETADYEPSNLLPASFLLATIVSNSIGRLDPKYKENPNAKALIQQHPELMDKLMKAWRERTFRDIRNLSA
jgi:hypothetical protein